MDQNLHRQSPANTNSVTTPSRTRRGLKDERGRHASCTRRTTRTGWGVPPKAHVGGGGHNEPDGSRPAIPKMVSEMGQRGSDRSRPVCAAELRTDEHLRSPTVAHRTSLRYPVQCIYFIVSFSSGWSLPYRRHHRHCAILCRRAQADNDRRSGGRSVSIASGASRRIGRRCADLRDPWILGTRERHADARNGHDG